MTISPQTRALALRAIAASMAQLHEISPGGLEPKLQVVWNSQHAIALDLARGADFSDMQACLQVLESRSLRLLEELPDVPHDDNGCWAFDGDAVARVLKWITPDHLALALSKGLVPTRATHKMIEFAPRAPGWDAFITGPFSRAAPGSASIRDMKDFLGAKSLARSRHPARACAYARAQAQHHPEFLRDRLEQVLSRKSLLNDGGKGLLLDCLALVAAGVSAEGLEQELHHKVMQVFADAPGHEKMRIHALRYDLEGVIAEARHDVLSGPGRQGPRSAKPNATTAIL